MKTNELKMKDKNTTQQEQRKISDNHCFSFFIFHFSFFTVFL